MTIFTVSTSVILMGRGLGDFIVKSADEKVKCETDVYAEELWPL